MWQMALELGIGAALGLPLLKAAVKSSPKIAGMLYDHFTRHNEVLGEAWVESYEKAAYALAEGVGYRSLLGRALGGLKANLENEFRRNIQERYLISFQEKTKISEGQLKRLRMATEDILREASRTTSAMYPKERWPKEIDIAHLFASPTQKQTIERALLNDLLSQPSTQAALKKHGIAQPEIEAFLLFDQMLLSAVLYFFRDQLLHNASIKSAMDAAQQQLQRLDTQRIGEQLEAQRDELAAQRAQQTKRLEQQQQQHQEAQAALLAMGQRLTETQAHIAEAVQAQNFAILATLGAQAQEIKLSQDKQHKTLEEAAQALETQQGQLRDIESSLSRLEEDNQRLREEMQKEFEEAKAIWGGLERQLQGFGESLGELREEFRTSFSALERKIEEGQAETNERLRHLEEMLERLGGIMISIGLPTEQVTIVHETTVYPKQTTLDIREAYKNWRQLSPQDTPRYGKLSLQMGTSLSSMGELDDAVLCFETAAQEAAQRHKEATSAQAQQKAQKDLALAHYNLHQVFLRQGALERALTSLKEASRLDPSEYMPFNMGIYDTQRVLGAGGMGCAFLCQHALSKKHVVVKTFWKAKEGKLHEVFSEAFKMQEADPEGVFIPRPLDIGYGDPIYNRRPFLVMEYVEGSLDGEQYLEKYGPLPFHEGVRLGARVAEALERAHARNICHFDLKPANLLFYKEGRDWMVKIIDFGLARAAHSLRDDLAKQHSRSSQRSVLATTAFGTMVYAPPEQLRPTAQKQPGPASDIYSFAKTLYRLMTGQDAQHFLPPLELQGGEWIGLIGRCLAAEMEKRPTAAELKARFEKMGAGRPEPVNPVFYTMAAQFARGGTLFESQESILWTMLQGFSTPRALGKEALSWALKEAPARRRAAQRAEEWLSKQDPNFYPLARVWSVMQERYSEDYNEQGLREVPQIEAVDVFRDDPAFVEEEANIRLLRWQLPFGTEQETGSKGPEPEDIVEITVGQWVAQVAWALRLWMRPLHDNEERMRRSNEYLHLPLSRYRELFALKMNGNFRVDSFCAKVTEICGWPVAVLDEQGQQADPQTKIGQLRLSGSKVFGCGDDIYFTLLEGPEGQLPKWLANHVLRSPLLREEGGLLASCAPKFRLSSERGEVTAYLKREKDKGKLRSLGDLWALYPELSAGDGLCFHVSEPDICRAYVIAQSALKDRPLPAKPSEESLRTRAALLAAHAKAKAKAASRGAAATLDTEDADESETFEPTATDSTSDESETFEPTAIDSTTGGVIDLNNLSEYPSETDNSSADVPPFSPTTTEPSQAPEGGGGGEDEPQETAQTTAGGEDEPKGGAQTTAGGHEVPVGGVEISIAPPQPPEAIVEFDGGEDIAPLTVYRKTMEWAVDWCLWLEILDPKTDQPAAEHLALRDVAWKTPQPSEISLAGHQKVKTFLKNVQRATGLKLRLLDKTGQHQADPEASLGHFRLPSSKWTTVRGKDFFVTLKPAKEAGFSPPWRAYGYLSLGNVGYDVLSVEDNGRIVKLYLEDGEQVFEVKLCADPPRIEKMRAFFREASDLTPGDVLGFVRSEEGVFRVYVFARQELFPEPKKPVSIVEKTVTDTDGHPPYKGGDEEEEELTDGDIILDSEATQPELDAIFVTHGRATVVELEAPSMVAMLKAQAEFALRQNNVEDALKAYTTLHNKHLDEVEQDLTLLQRVSAAMQYKRAMEMELEGNLLQATKLLEAAQVLDATFLPALVRQRIQSLREENEHKIKNRFQRMSRDAVQMAQTDPHAALQMLLETRSLEPRYWTARHQGWLAYLQSVCKAPQ